MHFFSRVFLPILLLGYIATETYLKLQHSSLCDEVGCKLAGELLNFDAIYLNYFGLVSVFFLIILGYLSLKNKFYEALFFIGLYTGIAFEATIISYQFIANPEPCIFCLGIFSSLLLIALFSQIKHFAITLAMVGAIFIGLHTLSISKNKVFTPLAGNYLIQSKTCPHCIKVKAYLSKHQIEYTAISTQEASARNFLKFAGIQSIPVLILKEKRQTTLLTGDKKIIAYFENQKVTQKTDIEKTVIKKVAIPAQSSISSGFSTDFLTAGDEDAGCAISVVATPSCEDNSSHGQP